MPQHTSQPFFYRFAIFLAALTLGLISVGGVVTSTGAGMTVPDWPNSYGYNMFLFPVSKWIGGVFWEHSHRLFASLVGFCTIILAIWATLKDSRVWFRTLCWVALAAVIFQGVLGGLRVVWNQDSIGIFHAAFAQSFFCLLAFIAFASSKGWWRGGQEIDRRAVGQYRNITLAITALVFVQLTLGATMRHEHAGLAVPDFPLAYGKLYPATDAATLEAINFDRTVVQEIDPVTPFQIHAHMAHRFGAAIIFVSAVGFGAWALRKSGLRQVFGGITTLWLVLIGTQVALGIFTVLMNKPADVATLHVVVGALSLCVAFLMVVRSGRVLRLDAERGVAVGGESIPTALPAETAKEAVA